MGWGGVVNASLRIRRDEDCITYVCQVEGFIKTYLITVQFLLALLIGNEVLQYHIGVF